MTIPDDQPRPAGRRRRLAALLLLGALLGAACSDGDGSGTETTRAGDGSPNSGPVPTLAGGIELPPVEPVRVLVADGLSFGQPLPSQQQAADAFLEDPEVAAVVARRVHSLRDGRFVGEALVLALDGAELFDQGVLDAFARGVVAALGSGDHEDIDLVGRTVFKALGADGTAIGFLEGNLCWSSSAGPTTTTSGWSSSVSSRPSPRGPRGRPSR